MRRIFISSMIPVFSFYVIFSYFLIGNAFAVNENRGISNLEYRNQAPFYPLDSEPYSPIYGVLPISGMAVSPVAYGSSLYVSNSDSFFVSEFDSAGSLVNSHFIVLSDHPGALATDYYGNLYIAKSGGGIARFLRINQSLDEHFVVNVNATSIYVNNFYDTIMYVSDTTKQRISKYSTISGSLIDSNFITGIKGYGMELYGTNLFVTLGQQNRIKIYDSRTGLLIDQTVDNDSLVKNVYSCVISADSVLYIPYAKDTLITVNDTLRYGISLYLVGFNADLESYDALPILIWGVYVIAFELVATVGCIVAEQGINVVTGINGAAGRPAPPLPLPPRPPPAPRVNRQQVGNIAQPNPIPLPVELLTFDFELVNNKVELKWSTLGEINNLGFEVERSADKISYMELGFVKGIGTISYPTNYSFVDKNLQRGIYHYRLKQIDFNGNFEYFDLPEAVTIGVPDKFFVDQNYPNPFNPVTSIAYGIPQSGNVKLKIFDMAGREIKTLVNEFRDAGYYVAKFDGSSLASGTYIYRIESGSFVSAKKMILLK